MPYVSKSCAKSGFIAIINGFRNFPYVDYAQQHKNKDRTKCTVFIS
ncbi:hypothetical protein RKLH11_2351 [Rhodobacteraceae bacterium KLH11]|nr:hypothetical protein RKLH11_2351 [Rhodobacteraceae bacterium KLH11]